LKRDSRLYLDDIFDAIDKIDNYVEGLSFEEFSADSKTVDAIVRNFEIIGEAAKAYSFRNQRNISSNPLETDGRNSG
jgi:uncharacterized protein with HEPN domain